MNEKVQVISPNTRYFLNLFPTDWYRSWSYSLSKTGLLYIYFSTIEMFFYLILYQISHITFCLIYNLPCFILVFSLGSHWK